MASFNSFTAAKNLRQKQTFVRDDGTTFDYSLVNLRDWCKNEYEVVSQLTINTANSRHRYDIIILINGLPLVQIELKRHNVSPLKAVEQIARYKKDRGNGYTPQAGDAILFDWDNDGVSDHIGVVSGVDAEGGVVYTIEGNSSDSVAERSYGLGQGCVMGYINCGKQQ